MESNIIVSRKLEVKCHQYAVELVLLSSWPNMTDQQEDHLKLYWIWHNLDDYDSRYRTYLNPILHMDTLEFQILNCINRMYSTYHDEDFLWSDSSAFHLPFWHLKQLLLANFNAIWFQYGVRPDRFPWSPGGPQECWLIVWWKIYILTSFSFNMPSSESGGQAGHRTGQLGSDDL